MSSEVTAATGVVQRRWPERRIDEKLPVRKAILCWPDKQLRKRGQIAAFLSCEGGHGLEGKLDHLDDLYARGVRSLQLVHMVQNNLGDVQSLPPVYNGLSAFGRDVVRRMNHLGMLVDVAHATFPTVKATVDSTSDPIMLSHTHLQSSTSPHLRLITVEHARRRMLERLSMGWRWCRVTV